MIHIVIGTKAQLIKMAPVIWTLQEKGLDFRLVSTGQHATTFLKLQKVFRFPRPDFTLADLGRDVATFLEAALWLSRAASYLLEPPLKLKNKVFGEVGGVCLIHGDTMSTLLSLSLARRAGLEVGLVEAGLTSGRLDRPFPEEIIRRVCQRRADYLFAPGDWAARNLHALNLKGRIIDTKENTVAESIDRTLAQAGHDDALPPLQPYFLACFHRLENIYHPLKLKRIVDLLIEAAARLPLILVAHRPTANALKRFRLDKKLRSNRISLIELQSYPRFLRLIRHAALVMTDGGSIQEECYYLGRPCLILRRNTERREGLGENAVLVGTDYHNALNFLERPDLLVRAPVAGANPSRIIVDALANISGSHP